MVSVDSFSFFIFFSFLATDGCRRLYSIELDIKFFPCTSIKSRQRSYSTGLCHMCFIQHLRHNNRLLFQLVNSLNVICTLTFRICMVPCANEFICYVKVVVHRLLMMNIFRYTPLCTQLITRETELICEVR